MRSLAALAAIFNEAGEVLLVRLSPHALPRPSGDITLMRIADAQSDGPARVKTVDRVEMLT